MVGWIKLHKKILNNPTVMKDTDHLAVWIYLLLKCSHPKYQAYVGKDKLEICEGQYLTGRKQIAEDLNINESKVTRILSLFEREHQIRQETSNKCRIITIEKWETYQAAVKSNISVSECSQNEETVKIEQQNEQPEPSVFNGSEVSSEQQIEQQVNNKRTTSEQQVNTKIRNIRNIRNINNNNSEEDKSSLSEPGRGKSDVYQEIIDHWNTLPDNIAKIAKISERGERKRLLDARLKDYSIAQIHAAIEEIPKSEFLMGGGNRGWTITFDWFVKPSNFPKVLEGNYRGKIKGGGSGNAYVDAIQSRYDPVTAFIQRGEE